MSDVWKLDDGWVLNIQSRFECFGVIKQIKCWSTLRSLPGLPEQVLMDFINTNKFNKDLVQIKAAQMQEKSQKRLRTIRQAKEFYVRSVDCFNSVTEQDHWILRARVHGQMKKIIYVSLIVIRITGDVVEILDSSCACPAGLGRSCKHVCAVLFFWHLFRSDFFCPTSHQNTWKVPNLQITGKRVAELQFRKLEAGKKMKHDNYYQDCDLYFDPRPPTLIPMTPEKKMLLDKLISSVQLSQPNSLFLAFHTPVKPLEAQTALYNTQDNGLLNLFELFKAYRRDNESTNFIEYARNYFTFNQVLIDDQTKQQAADTAWKFLKLGLPTASNAHSIFTKVKSIQASKSTDIHDPRSILKKLFQVSSFRSAAMAEGLRMETEIRNFYLNIKQKTTKGGQLVCHGLKIYEKSGLLGASVDGIFSCDGEDPRILEIKYVCDLTKQKCLTQLGSLNPNHTYYTQVQVGMGVYGIAKCDFILYETEKLYQIINVPFDESHFFKVLTSCNSFFENFIMPFVSNPTLALQLK